MSVSVLSRKNCLGVLQCGRVGLADVDLVRIEGSRRELDME